MRAFAPIKDFADADYDPFADSAANFGRTLDPFKDMARLRKDGPVHEVDYRALVGEMPSAAIRTSGQFLVIGYDAVEQILRDPVTFSSAALKKTTGLAFGQDVVVSMDAPDHPKFRRVFQQPLLPHVVGKWGSAIVGPVIDELMGKFKDRGSAELVAEFTNQFPFLIIFRMLGLPEEDMAVFHKLAIAQLNYHLDPSKAIEAGQNLGTYFTDMLAARRANPGEDLVSELLAAKVDDEPLPESVLISFLRLLTTAGGDTTFRSTSTMLTALLTDPEQYRAIEADRSLIPAAIDETLRWDVPATFVHRVAANDTELGGVKIPAGSFVLTAIGAANRDPAHFDDPDRFDIFRKTKTRPLRFGGGPHVCLGQHLARLEMARAMNALLDHCPNLRLDPDKPAPVILGSEMRGPDYIYVNFDPVVDKHS